MESQTPQGVHHERRRVGVRAKSVLLLHGAIVFLWSRRWLLGVMAAFVLIAFVVRMRTVPPFRGDGQEYILMTYSLATQGNVSITPLEAGIYRSKYNPWRWVSVRPGEYPLVKGADGRERCIHSPVVSALVVPFFWLCNYNSPMEGRFRCYSVFGLWAVLVCWFLLSRFWILSAGRDLKRFDRWGLPLLAGFVILFSPISIYSDWPHTEVGIFLLLSLFFYWLARKRFVPAAVALGLAVGQNMACGFWGILLAVEVVRSYRAEVDTESSGRRWRPYALSLALVPIPALLLSLHSYYLYGTFSLLPRYGSGDPSYICLSRTLRFYIDPFFGLLWFYPWIFVGLFTPASRSAFFVRLAVSIPIAAVSTAVTNLHSEMVGLRYLVFVYPAFLFLRVSFPTRWFGRAAFAVYGIFCVWLTHTFVFQPNRVEEYTSILRSGVYPALQSTFRFIPALYNPEPESFVENAFDADGFRAEAIAGRVSDRCWYVYVSRAALPPGKATLILLAPDSATTAARERIRFCVNSSIRFREFVVDGKAGQWRLPFEVDADDYLGSPGWSDYLYLKTAHEMLEPFAIEFPSSDVLGLRYPARKDRPPRH